MSVLDRINVWLMALLAVPTAVSLVMLATFERQPGGAQAVSDDGASIIRHAVLHRQASIDQGQATLPGTLMKMYGLSEDKARTWADRIESGVAGTAVPPVILSALIRVESTWGEKARSHRGAIGPAQIRPQYHQQRCAGLDLLMADDNVRCAAIVLQHYHDTCGGSWTDALTCYNVGPTGRNEPGGPEAAARYLTKISNALGEQAHLLSSARSVASL